MRWFMRAIASALAASLESRLFEPAYKNETEWQIYKLQEALAGNEVKAQTAKFIGALSGALISHTPEGAYSAANSAELVYRNNMTEHMLYEFPRLAAAVKGSGTRNPNFSVGAGTSNETDRLGKIKLPA
ncbi:hypothetical protein [Photorhabdus asymbiotica]|uniref:hypothetical protein n=1 Tax=Photorhabdus asymbiotica TaxID=291112 RepID=UPI003DA6F615